MDQVTVGTYLIKVPTVADVPELFDLMTGAENVDMKIIVGSMLKNCVFLDGAPLGDRIKDVPLKDLRPLISTLTELAGLTEKK